MHRVAQVDDLRQDPQRTLSDWFGSPVQGRPPNFPAPVRILMWAFVTSPRRDLFRHAAASVLGAFRRV